MEETQRHRDAFEFYYALGSKRNCPKVARKFAVSDNSAKKWSKAFNWSERVRIRDIDVTRGVAAKVTETNIDVRAKALKQMQNLENILWSMIQTAFSTDPNTGKPIINIRVETTRDIKGLSDTLLRMEEIKLKLVGEPERHEHTIKTEDIHATIKKYENALNEIREE